MDDVQHMFLQAVFTSIPVTLGVIVNFVIQLIHKRLTGTDAPSSVPEKAADKDG